MKKTLILILLIFLISSCKEKKQIENLSDKIENKTVESNENVKDSSFLENEKLKQNIIEEIEDPIVEPYELDKLYNFNPIKNVNLENVEMTLENGEISIFYEDQLIISIIDLNYKPEIIQNYCKKHDFYDLYSSGFLLTSENKRNPGVILWEQGIIKIYKKTNEEHWLNLPYYSGFGNYFILKDTWCVKKEYYDAYKFKTIPSVWASNIYIIDINTDKIVYYIKGKELHKEPQLGIDKIEYKESEFKVRIGNSHDSDEFVDFSIFTDNDNFRYEVYDKYEYPSRE